MLDRTGKTYKKFNRIELIQTTAYKIKMFQTKTMLSLKQRPIGMVGALNESLTEQYKQNYLGRCKSH